MRALLLLPAAAAVLALALAAGARAEPGLENPALLQDRGPVRIDGDAGFTAENGVRGGSGTAEDPFLLAHWRIAGAGQLVTIANTTKAWVARNLDLRGTCDPAPGPFACAAEVGILVQNAQGGTVIRNRLAGLDRSAVWVGRSPGVEVVENLVEGGGAANQGTGILVHESHASAVRGNRLLGVGPANSTAAAAVRVWLSDDVLVQGNEVRDATDEAINLLSARRAEVMDNTVLGSRNIGLLVQGRDARVAYNTLEDNRIAVLVSQGTLHLERNVLAGNFIGLQLAVRTNVTGRENNLEGHGHAALLVAANATADVPESWWGAADGPSINGSGPGRGDVVRLADAATSVFRHRPFLGDRAAAAGAFAERAGRFLVTGGSAGPGGPGGAADPAPVAVFEGPSSALLGEEARFSAARSHDPEGGALRYQWDMGDGAVLGGLRVAHAYNRTGEFVVALTVTDPTGLRGTASVALRVARAPLGVQLLVNATATRGEELLVRAVPTGQPLGPVAFRFTAEGPGTFAGEPAAQNTTRFRFPAPREHLVGVEARAGGEVATAFQRVLVVNRPPVARVAVEPASGDTATEFAFSAAGSTDADGDALAFTWDFGGGSTSGGANVTRRFPREGLHVVQLTAFDGFASATAQVGVQVAPAAGQGGGNGAPGPAALAALAALALGARLRGRR